MFYWLTINIQCFSNDIVMKTGSCSRSSHCFVFLHKRKMVLIGKHSCIFVQPGSKQRGQRRREEQGGKQCPLLGSASHFNKPAPTELKRHKLTSLTLGQATSRWVKSADGPNSRLCVLFGTDSQRVMSFCFRTEVVLRCYVKELERHILK